jgi:alkylation response protein AidB-like acyl-CoA dehydrogenase
MDGTELTALRQTTRRFLRERVPSLEVRRLMDHPTGFDRDLWAGLAALGVPGLAIPERYGGAGCTFAVLATVLTETGRVLLPAPVLPTVLAAAAVLATGDEEAQKAVLPGIAAGDTVATLALDTATLRAARHAGGWRLYGSAGPVIDGHVADTIVVAALTGHGPTLFTARRPGCTPTPTFDPTRRLARIAFNATPATVLGEPGQAGPVLDQVRDLAATALAAEQVGGAGSCLDAAVAYAKTRVQFGRPIGSFQAIQHRCADLLLTLESARSAAQHAAELAAKSSDELPIYAALAKSVCSTAYLRIAAENIQLHGGIAITWEHDAHLHLRRAKSGEALFGTPAWHRSRLAGLVGIDPRAEAVVGAQPHC